MESTSAIKIIPNEDRIAIAEVDYIIHHMNEFYLNKIPQKIRDYITIVKKKNIEIYVDPKIPLEKQGLKEYTLYLLMILNLKYWCNDERRRDILAMMENNQRKYDEKINNIFEQANSLTTASEENVESTATNKPKQVITVNNNSETKEEENKLDDAQEGKQDETDEKAIAEKPKENFFTKFLNKVKLMFKHKE